MKETCVLLSLHPEWWEKMLRGEKIDELWRAIPRKVSCPFTVIVYATAPISAIVGEFICVSIREAKPNEELVETSCVPLDAIIEYTDARKSVYAWRVITPRKTGSLTLEKLGLRRPPQSWCYVK